MYTNNPFNKVICHMWFENLPKGPTLGPPPELCPGPIWGLIVLCRTPADFFEYSAWEKAFDYLQTQFETQKRWHDKVFGKTPGFLIYRAWWKEFFVILDHFLPFYPPNNPKNQNFEKMKKRPGDIIILHMCTKNDNHMMYGSGEMECDRRSNRQMDRKSDI